MFNASRALLVFVLSSNNIFQVQLLKHVFIENKDFISRFANVFLHPVTDDIAPGYSSVVYR